MKANYRRKVVEVIATQWFKMGDHPAVIENALYLTPSIQTDFGFVEVGVGDWVVEIDGKIKILKDRYFKQHYEAIPDFNYKSKFIFTTDCSD
jgi:uncharacterized protein Usg